MRKKVYKYLLQKMNKLKKINFRNERGQWIFINYKFF